MKEVIRQYGAMIISIIVSGAMLVIIPTCLSAVNSFVADVGKGKLESSFVGDSYAQWKADEDIHLSYKLRQEINQGQYVPVQELIEVRDSQGKSCHCLVYYIQDDRGNECKLRTYRSKECFFFEQSGVYQVYIRSEDDNGRTETAKISLPVNCRRRS